MVPDITMCKGTGCPLRNSCYRFTATPNEYRQSYFVVEPFVYSHGYGRCVEFVPNREDARDEQG